MKLVAGLIVAAILTGCSSITVGPPSSAQDVYKNSPHQHERRDAR